jgi:hypothetical protein
MPVTRLRPALILGASAFWLGASCYRSFANRDVFGRWSIPYAIVMASLTVALPLLWAWLARSAAPHREDPRGLLALRRRLVDLAVLTGGFAHLRAAWLDPDSGQRFLDLNLFGSADALSAGLSWLSLVGLYGAGVTWAAGLRPGLPRNAAVVGCALGFTLLIAEGLTRSRVVLHPTTQGFPTYSSQAWEHRYVRLNSDGFRDGEIFQAAPRKQHRVLVVGDSVAFGYGLERLEDRFGEALAKALSQDRGEAWRSISAARPDAHTLDHLRFLETALRHRPDAIVLLYGLNDIDYLVPITQRDEIVFGSPFHPLRIAFLNLYVVQEIYARVRHLRFSPERAGGADRPISSELMSQHMRDLGRFVSIARGHTCAVAIAPLAWLARGSPGIRQRYLEFVERADAEGLPVWSTLEPFENEDYASLIVNPLDHHPSAKTNRIAAAAVAKKLRLALTACGRSSGSSSGNSARREGSLEEPEGRDQTD